MRNSGLRAFTYHLVAAAVIGASALGSELDFTAGIGYEFISQEFFLDSLIESGQDSLAATAALKTTYLDDVKARLVLKYSPFEDRRLLFHGQYEHSPEFIRTKLQGDFRHKFSRLGLDFGSELDWRARHSDGGGAGDDYLAGRAESKLTLPLGTTVSARWKVQADFVDFDSASDLVYGYYRIGGKAGIGKSFADFSMLDADFFAVARRVPDSSALNYVSVGVQGAYLGFYAGGGFDLFGRAERKDYEQPGGKGDYWRTELEGRNRTQLGAGYFCRQALDFELNLFSPSEPISYDYARVGLTVLWGVESGSLEFSLGGDFEYQAELHTELGSSDTYFESGLAAELGLVGTDRIFGSVESVLGHRGLATETDLQTDFSFERLNLMADWNLPGMLSLNILLSAEWEWHANEEENSQIFLISSGLSCSF